MGGGGPLRPSSRARHSRCRAPDSAPACDAEPNPARGLSGCGSEWTPCGLLRVSAGAAEPASRGRVTSGAARRAYARPGLGVRDRPVFAPRDAEDQGSDQEWQRRGRLHSSSQEAGHDSTYLALCARERLSVKAPDPQLQGPQPVRGPAHRKQSLGPRKRMRLKHAPKNDGLDGTHKRSRKCVPTPSAAATHCGRPSGLKLVDDAWMPPRRRRLGPAPPFRPPWVRALRGRISPRGPSHSLRSAHRGPLKETSAKPHSCPGSLYRTWHGK